MAESEPDARPDQTTPIRHDHPAHEEPDVTTTHPVGDVITTADPAPPARRGVDWLTLVVGVLTLAVAVAAFVGTVPDLGGFDPRWLLALGAAVVGALLLIGARRRAR